jgi:hypothetical protein
MRRLFLVVAVFSLLLASNVYACVGEDCKLDSNVQDTNDGNQGYIFTYCGEKGNNSLGTWVDPKDVPELKGENGKDGINGINGSNGIDGRDGLDGRDGINGLNGINGSDGKDGTNGVDGQNGHDGQAGYTPIKGVDYVDGKDGQDGIKGTDGKDGKQGEVGATGATGDKGTDGKTPIKNIDYFDGINGLNGADGKDVDPKTVNEINNKIDNNSNHINKLEESQYIVGGVLRIKSTKKWDVDLFADYSTNRQMIDRSGIRFIYKVGESYTDRELKKINKRLEELEK